MTKENGDPRRDSAKVYDKAAVDFQAKAPELLTYKYIVRPAIVKALEEFVPTGRDRKTALDVGSASGRNVRALLAQGFLPENVLGVDISPEQVEIARSEFPKATFEVGDIGSHQLKPNSRDLALLVMVAEFLDEETYPIALSKIHSSMRDNGVFIYITTHPGRYEVKYGVTDGEVVTKGPWGDDEFINYVRSVEAQVDAVEDAGFRVERVEELKLPEKLENQDHARRAKFKYGDVPARLVIVAKKTSE